MDHMIVPPHVSFKTQMIGTVEIVMAFALAGSSLVVAKLLSMRVPVFLTGCLSLTIALVCMLPAQALKRKELRKLNRGEIGLMFLQALFGIVLFRVFTLYGLRHTTTADAAIVTAAAPAVMALFSVVLLKEKIRLNSVLGVSAALGALILINLDTITQTTGSGKLWGNLLIALAVVSEVLLTIFRRFTKTGISSVTNTTILTFIAICLMLPVALIELKTFSPGSMTLNDWMGIVYYGAVATALAYMLWGDGALKIPATYTGVASVSMPISALLLSHPILKETLTGHHVLGCLLAVSGIVVCNFSSRIKP